VVCNRPKAGPAKRRRAAKSVGATEALAGGKGQREWIAVRPGGEKRSQAKGSSTAGPLELPKIKESRGGGFVPPFSIAWL